MQKKYIVLIVSLSLVVVLTIATIFYIVANWTHVDRVRNIKAHACNVARAIDSYSVEVGCIPTGSKVIVREICGEGKLDEPVLKCENGGIRDVWGNDYRIDIIVRLRSAGEDGKLFTDDDEVAQCELDQ